MICGRTKEGNKIFLIPNSDGQTSLHMAAIKKDFSTIEYLLAWLRVYYYIEPNYSHHHFSDGSHTESRTTGGYRYDMMLSNLLIKDKFGKTALDYNKIETAQIFQPFVSMVRKGILKS